MHWDFKWQTNNDSGTIIVETPQKYTENHIVVSTSYYERLRFDFRPTGETLALFLSFSVSPIKFWYCDLNMQPSYILTDLYRIINPLYHLFPWKVSLNIHLTPPPKKERS
jgi:hypothetical protein